MGKVKRSKRRPDQYENSRLSRNEILRNKIIGRLMLHGKKATIEKIVNKALDQSGTLDKLDEIFEKNRPAKIVKPVVIAGSTKSIPMTPTPEQSDKAVARHIRNAVRKIVATGKNSVDALTQVLKNGLNGTGALDESKKALEAIAKANIAYGTYRFK